MQGLFGIIMQWVFILLSLQWQYYYSVQKILLLITSNVTLLSEYGDVDVIGNKETWFMFDED
jgi:nicotinamide riboside transporter PnuC